ncbi:hypothetical protein CT0861_06999, partial [Colletotrichum tofieldiae]
NPKPRKDNHPIRPDKTPPVVAKPPQIPPRCLAKSVISSSSLRLPGERTLPPPASSAAARTPRSSSRFAASATSTLSSSRTPTRPRSSSSPFPLSSRSRTSPRRTPRASPPHKRSPTLELEKSTTSLRWRNRRARVAHLHEVNGMILWGGYWPVGLWEKRSGGLCLFPRKRSTDDTFTRHTASRDYYLGKLRIEMDLSTPC